VRFRAEGVGGALFEMKKTAGIANRGLNKVLSVNLLNVTIQRVGALFDFRRFQKGRQGFRVICLIP